MICLYVKLWHVWHVWHVVGIKLKKNKKINGIF